MSIKTRSSKYHLTQQISFSPNYISTNNNQILYCRIDKMLHFYDSTPHKSSNCFTNTDAPGCIHQSDHSVTTVTVTEIPPWYHEGNSLRLELESKICKKSMKEQEVKLRLFKSYAKILTTEPEFLSLQKKDHSMFKWYFSKLHIALTKSFRLLETSVFLITLSQSNSSSPPPSPLPSPTAFENVIVHLVTHPSHVGWQLSHLPSVNEVWRWQAPYNCTILFWTRCVGGCSPHSIQRNG